MITLAWAVRCEEGCLGTCKSTEGVWSWLGEVCSRDAAASLFEKLAAWCLQFAESQATSSPEMETPAWSKSGRHAGRQSASLSWGW